jgi:carboxylate-amine ligase
MVSRRWREPAMVADVATTCHQGARRATLAPVGPATGAGDTVQIKFTQSHRSRLGIEWELACVDHTTGELAPAAPELLALVGHTEGFPQVTRELLTNTIELVSAPSATVGPAVAELADLLDRVRAAANPRGVDLMCAGTHPFSRARDQRVTPGSPRYDTLMDRTRW